MTEYWVSQAKHYCKVCNCWIADNKISRQNHESTIRHKKNTENLVKQKRKDALHGARNDQELQQQLAAIEKAALASVQTDKLKSTVTMHQTINRPYSGSWNGSNGQKMEPAAAPIVKKEENNGIYSIRGKVYLDGRIFEDKLMKDVKCEVFVEEIDEWLPAVIIHRHEKPIPNTSISLKSFDVEYEIISPDGVESKEFENDVRSDRLRIPSAEKGEGYQIHDAYVPPPLPIQPIIQESTGIGGWQTVSVKVVDEAKEWEEHEAAVEAMRAEKNEVELPESTGSARVDDSGPITGKLYKGFIIEDVAVEAKFHKDTSNETDTVTFKRRKLSEKTEIKVENPSNNTPVETVSKPKVRNIRKKDSN